MEEIFFGIFSLIGIFAILAFIYDSLLKATKEMDFRDSRIDELEERVYELERRIEKRK
ncbi:hypothetical protein V3H55_28465 [Klebsiella quasipneumoniae]|uniref:hypothetical protein n=1 Tax=Klebsiella quasipneumoniae TaxID=1463165 RepID=UPI002F25F097|nr:hypothetical protein [Salmonella enterica subsp. enterica serovar Infantis]